MNTITEKKETKCIKENLIFPDNFDTRNTGWYAYFEGFNISITFNQQNYLITIRKLYESNLIKYTAKDHMEINKILLAIPKRTSARKPYQK